MGNLTLQERSRGVSFNRNVACIPILHLRNYTDQEIKDTWYTRQEGQAIKSENKLTASLIDNGTEFEEGVIFSSRGLEIMTVSGKARKHTRRLFAYRAVVDEQDRQRKLGIPCDPEAISRTYSKCTFASKTGAWLMADIDKQTAMHIMKSDDGPVVVPQTETHQHQVTKKTTLRNRCLGAVHGFRHRLRLGATAALVTRT